MTVVGGIAGIARIVGIGLLVLAALAAVLPGLTGAPVVILVGLLLLVAGGARAWFGWAAWAEGRGAAGLVFGGLAAVCGLAIVLNPVSTLERVATFVAVYLVLDGLAALVFSLGARDDDRTPVRGEALLSVLLGASMWLGWPLSGLRALGVLLAVKLASAGALVLRVGRGMKRVDDRITAFRERLDR